MIRQLVEKRQNQSGNSLIEALVSLLIFGITTSGMLKFTQVAASEHRESTIRNLALYQVKNAIENTNSDSFFESTNTIAMAGQPGAVAKAANNANSKVESSNYQFNDVVSIRNGQVGETIVRGVSMPKNAAVSLDNLNLEFNYGLESVNLAAAETGQEKETGAETKTSEKESAAAAARDRVNSAFQLDFDSRSASSTNGQQ